jgi:hypothetical protein
MLTFLFLISTIHGCSSIRHGVARRDVSFSRLQQYQLSYNEHDNQDLPALNEVLKVIAPLNALRWLVL